MTLKNSFGGLLLATVTGLAFVSLSQPVQADPPGGCPPGLANKNPLCMPPGQYKKLYEHKRYRRGDEISDWRSYDRLRYREYGLLEPGPGRSYIRIGNDAYLIAEATQRVIEVINLLDSGR